MRVLWVCNIMLPVVAEHLHKEASNKEGWLTGMSAAILERGEENGICLGIAFPMEMEQGCSVKEGHTMKEEHTMKVERSVETEGYHEKLIIDGRELYCYGFYEDTAHPEIYDPALEGRLSRIIEAFQPDVIHCFGTEYPHTLAVSRVAPRKDRILISIQGLCSVYANTYRANLPYKVWHRATLRDRLKKDSLMQQQQKFILRGRWEIEAIKNAGNVAGRTDWDYHYTKEWNPRVRYFTLNETLRPDFYQGQWEEKACEPDTIFVSQGDYPVKGLHYLLLALPAVREKFPRVKLYVAGNSLVKDRTVMEKLKSSSYGSYLRGIIRDYRLKERVVFLGKLDQKQMKERFLASGLFVCCSTIENSPNSLGEAMLLGVPCVSADVGGIPSLFRDHVDGILYRGYRTGKNSFDNTCDVSLSEEEQLENNVRALADAIIEMWEHPEAKLQYGINARKHARETHDSYINYQKMTEVYSEIAGKE